MHGGNSPVVQDADKSLYSPTDYHRPPTPPDGSAKSSILAQIERTSPMSYKPPGFKPRKPIEPIIPQEPDPPSKFASAVGLITTPVRYLSSFFSSHHDAAPVDPSLSYQQGNRKSPSLPKELIPQAAKNKTQLVVSDKGDKNLKKSDKTDKPDKNDKTDKSDKADKLDKTDLKSVKENPDLVGDVPSKPEHASGKTKQNEGKNNKQNENKFSKHSDNKKVIKVNSQSKPRSVSSHSVRRYNDRSSASKKQTSSKPKHYTGIEFETSGSAFKIKSPGSEEKSRDSSVNNRHKSNRFASKDRGNVWKRSSNAPRPIAARIISAQGERVESFNELSDVAENVSYQHLHNGSVSVMNTSCASANSYTSRDKPLTFSGHRSKSTPRRRENPNKSNSASSTYVPVEPASIDNGLKNGVALNPRVPNGDTYPTRSDRIKAVNETKNNVGKTESESRPKPAAATKKSQKSKSPHRSRSRSLTKKNNKRSRSQRSRSANRRTRSKSRSLTKTCSNPVTLDDKVKCISYVDDIAKENAIDQKLSEQTSVTEVKNQPSPKKESCIKETIIGEAIKQDKTPATANTEVVPEQNLIAGKTPVVASDPVVQPAPALDESSVASNISEEKPVENQPEQPTEEVPLPVRRRGGDARRVAGRDSHQRSNILGILAPKNMQHSMRAKELTRPAILTRKPLAMSNTMNIRAGTKPILKPANFPS